MKNNFYVKQSKCYTSMLEARPVVIQGIYLNIPSVPIGECAVSSIPILNVVMKESCHSCMHSLNVYMIVLDMQTVFFVPLYHDTSPLPPTSGLLNIFKWK
jgi:hypothetical protein